MSDGVLKVIIFELRRALGDDPVAPRLIETVPRQGYRFIAPRGQVRRIPAAADVRAALVGRGALLAQLDRRREKEAAAPGFDMSPSSITLDEPRPEEEEPGGRPD